MLRTVYVRLRSADRDYAGHKAFAMNDISVALNSLGSSPPGGAARSGGMAQSQSDAILQGAISTLQTVQNSLSVAGAREAVAAAIQELNVALTIR
jgi:hypothetical protein